MPDEKNLNDTPKLGLIITLALFASGFVVEILLHLPLLNLPYYWDEAGYFIPAAYDIFNTSDFIPHTTLSNAHPPLLMAYLALAWKLFGYSFVVTRIACLAFASAALVAVYHLARRFANTSVAFATIICTALYAVFFAQSSLAHLDMAAAAFTLCGLLFYLPCDEEIERRNDEHKSENGSPSQTCVMTNSTSRLLTSTLFFALAALSKETAILTPFALVAWSFACQVFDSRQHQFNARRHQFNVRRFAVSLVPLFSAVPLALWFAYHFARTGYVFGNPEFVRYNVTSTLDASRILMVAAQRLWHVTGYMNLWALTVPALVVMMRPPIKDAIHGKASSARRRIDARVQLVFLIVILAHVVALSIVGGAVLARYMLPALPLVILIHVSTLRRRVRRWKFIIAFVGAAFIASWFINPPHRFPWEENLAYRHYISMHKNAAQFLERRHAQSRVLTAWTASDELARPFLGYVTRPLSVVKVEHFSADEILQRDERSFDVVLAFSTNYAGDMSAAAIANQIKGRIVYQEQHGKQWIAVIEK